jgi:sigma-B regulation protein RsbU (phosphoserine phosphatase)
MSGSGGDPVTRLTWELSLAYEALAAVYAMSQRLGKLDSEAAIWQALQDAIARVIPVRCGRILADSADGWVQLHAWGECPPITDVADVVAELEGVCAGRASARINDPGQLACLAGMPDAYGLLAVPVQDTQRTIGWLMLVDAIDAQGPRLLTTSDQKLAVTLAQQVGFALTSRRMAREEVRLARLDRELEIAREIQQSLLIPEPVSLAGWEIALESHPAYEVSGDFCGYERSEWGGAGLLMTDVMGKGVPAAMFAAMARTVLLALGAPTDPAMLVQRLRRVLLPDLTRSESFVALTYLSLQPANGLVRVLNAGNPPVLLRRGDGQVEVIESTGPPLGWPGRQAVVQSLSLQSGDVLLVCSDGIIDQPNPAGEAFGEERLRQSLAAHEDVGDLIAAVFADLRQHQDDRPAMDDMTLAVLRCVPT